MSGDADTERTVYSSILHPTNLTSEGIDAFAHALRIALDAKGRITVLHVTGDKRTPWTEFPGIRDTLVRWGKLDSGASREAVAHLGMQAVKLRLKGVSPVKGILQRAHTSDSDIVVLASHQREGLSRWTAPSHSEPVARLVGMPSLIVPVGCRGFVDIRSGDVDVKRVLVPVGHRPAALPGLQALSRLLHTFGVDDVEIRLLHVGGGDRPTASIPRPKPGWNEVEQSEDGAVIDVIVEQSKEWQADLVVMTTRGHDSPWDQLWGSTTERVLRQVRCPMLVVPVSR